jgi:hypothetical protein
VARRGHGKDHDRRFLALELVHRANACPRQTVLQLEHLRVVGRDDQNIVQGDGAFLAVTIDPRCVRAYNFVDERSNGICFFWRRTLIALVGYREVAQA